MSSAKRSRSNTSSSSRSSADRYAPVSPPKTPPQGRRPSITSPMNWLTRSSTSVAAHPAPYAPSKPVRISEPHFSTAFDAINVPRAAALGTGAVVVKTPQEALAPPAESPEEAVVYTQELPDDRADLPSPPRSPPLPPIPLEREEHRMPQLPPCPTRAPPPPPSVDNVPGPSTKRPALKSSRAEHCPPVPSLPVNMPSSPPQADFNPILVSEVPAPNVDPSKVVVSLETSTMTHRTTMSTLMSRPSFLATYLKTLIHDPDGASIYSEASDGDSTFPSIFHNHLTSSGMLPRSATMLHIFLDRPSAPYAHILAYLRSPPSTPEHPAVLPHAIQLTRYSAARLEALLELRDEARYLDLDELYKLCMEEIRLRHAASSLGPGTHSRGFSNSSNVSLHSLHTLTEKAEPEETYSRDSGVSTGTGHSSPSPRSYSSESAWQDPLPSAGLQQRVRERSEVKKSAIGSMRSRPTGPWI